MCKFQARKKCATAIPFRRLTLETEHLKLQLRNHIHPAQSEEQGGGKQVLVVGVDFGKAVFGGGGEVDGVGGAEIGGGRGGGEHALDAVKDGIGEGKPFQMSCACLIMDLGEEVLVLSGSGGAFPNLAKGGGRKLGAPMKRTSEDRL